MLKTELANQRKYLLYGFLIGLLIVFVVGVIPATKSVIQAKSCGGGIPMGFGGGSVPCTPLFRLFIGFLFFITFLQFFWWLVAILFFIPIITGLIIAATSMKEKTARLVMASASIATLSFGIFTQFTPAGTRIGYNPSLPKIEDFDTNPEKCILPAGLVCTNFYIAGPDNAFLEIQNGIGYDIEIKDIYVGSCSGEISTSTLARGDKKSFRIGGNCNFGKPGNEFNGDIKIEYYMPDTGLTKTAYGKVTAKIVK